MVPLKSHITILKKVNPLIRRKIMFHFHINFFQSEVFQNFQASIIFFFTDFDESTPENSLGTPLFINNKISTTGNN